MPKNMRFASLADMPEHVWKRLSPADRVPSMPIRTAPLPPNKYHAQKVQDPETGTQIDSKRELKHLQRLRSALKAGDIQMLATQVTFAIEGGRYIADFLTGVMRPDGAFELEVLDAKGVKTPVYNRSKKQMLERYGIQVKEL